MNTLTSDLLIHTFSFLDTYTLSLSSQVCNRWNALITERPHASEGETNKVRSMMEAIWKQKCIERWGERSVEQWEKDTSLWSKCYKLHKKWERGLCETTYFKSAGRADEVHCRLFQRVENYALFEISPPTLLEEFTGKTIELKIPPNNIARYNLVASNDEFVIVANCSPPGTLNIFEKSTGNLSNSIQNVNSNKDYILAIACHEQQIATRSSDGVLRIWDIKTGVQQDSFTHPKFNRNSSLLWIEDKIFVFNPGLLIVNLSNRQINSLKVKICTDGSHNHHIVANSKWLAYWRTDVPWSPQVYDLQQDNPELAFSLPEEEKNKCVAETLLHDDLILIRHLFETKTGENINLIKAWNIKTGQLAFTKYYGHAIYHMIAHEKQLILYGDSIVVHHFNDEPFTLSSTSLQKDEVIPSNPALFENAMPISKRREKKLFARIQQLFYRIKAIVERCLLLIAQTLFKPHQPLTFP